jgi:hypothetical protein
MDLDSCETVLLRNKPGRTPIGGQRSARGFELALERLLSVELPEGKRNGDAREIQKYRR